MSPDPLIVKPALVRRYPTELSVGSSVLAPTFWALQLAGCHRPPRLSRSNVAVAPVAVWLAPLSPPKNWGEDRSVEGGEVTNSPAWTVPGNPVSLTVPTFVQLVPSGDS